MYLKDCKKPCTGPACLNVGSYDRSNLRRMWPPVPLVQWSLLTKPSCRSTHVQNMADGRDGDDEYERPRKIPKTLKEKDTGKRLIVILEKASLETVKNGKSFELLNCDKHKTIMRKNKKDPATARPDIAHQSLLMLLDSPLNKAGLLQIYIHTERNVLIEINPHTRIPRTFDRFCGLMVQLLHKLSIHAADGPQKLLKVIKNPVTDHLPTGCRKIGTSFHSEKLTNLKDIIPKDEPIVFVVGAMAHGSIDVPYVEETVAISQYPLSGALTCAKICTAFEEAWGVQ